MIFSLALLLLSPLITLLLLTLNTFEVDFLNNLVVFNKEISNIRIL